MKITTKTRYGIRALICIAKNTDNNTLIRIKEISELEKISVQYLEQILYKLKKAEIIEGKRGPNGGYKLLKTPAEITLYELFKILESKVKVVICDIKADTCVNKDCSTKYLWDKLNNTIETMLKGTTLQELMGNRCK